MHEPDTTETAEETEVPLCPHCFEPVSETDATCPYCAHPLTALNNMQPIAIYYAIAYFYTRAKQGAFPAVYLFAFAALLLTPLLTLLVAGVLGGADTIYELELWDIPGLTLMLAIIGTPAYLFTVIFRAYSARHDQKHLVPPPE